MKVDPPLSIPTQRSENMTPEKNQKYKFLRLGLGDWEKVIGLGILVAGSDLVTRIRHSNEYLVTYSTKIRIFLFILGSGLTFIVQYLKSFSIGRDQRKYPTESRRQDSPGDSFLD